MWQDNAVEYLLGACLPCLAESAVLQQSHCIESTPGSVSPRIQRLQMQSTLVSHCMPRFTGVHLPRSRSPASISSPALPLGER